LEKLEEVLIAADYDALPIIEAEAVEVQPCLG
jgi:metal-dependent amidase/aminoacylase/carboxypeptidase family protein